VKLNLGRDDLAWINMQYRRDAAEAMRRIVAVIDRILGGDSSAALSPGDLGWIRATCLDKIDLVSGREGAA